MLLTLTLPHDEGDSLKRVIAAVRESFGSLVAGKGWQSDKNRFGLGHYIRAHDCTHGPNGWHFHVHVLLFAELALSEDRLAALEASLHRRWTSAVVRSGFRATTREHGIRLEQARERSDVARYICQVVTGDDSERPRPVAMELTRGDLKSARHDGHRTPWELLAGAADTGDPRALALWHEWERETRGVRAIRWSNGLHKLVGVKDHTDEDIVTEVIGGEVIYEFGPNEWYFVSRHPGSRARVLDLAEAGGKESVASYVSHRLVALVTECKAAVWPRNASPEDAPFDDTTYGD